MSQVFAFAIGISQTNSNNEVLECLFPMPFLNPTHAILEAAKQVDHGPQQVDPRVVATLNAGADNQLVPERLLQADKPLTVIRLDEDTDITSTAEAYLKLQLLSHRLSRPNTLNLDGIFGHLPNLAWTSQGAMDLEALATARIDARVRGDHLEVSSVDKFPK
ncbi:MAG: 2,3,4,5-tetrahydropyridine-2,6-dicarboxylate N-succinyltransferase, partial [Gammaproteobacteria bacterium]|nr:2,3,4,5-tetrahydropyridine-2,6-dicarboxylate N-succinyltransferase [Gammaproteobacteria bacterium]